MHERRPEQPQRRNLLLPKLIRAIFHRTRGQVSEQPIMIREHVAAIFQQEELTTTPNVPAENLSDINKRRRQSHLEYAINQFGKTVGTAFHNYSYDKFTENKGADPRLFAEAIVTAMETGTRDEKVNAITALLHAVEERDNFVRNEAGDWIANVWRHMPDRLSSH